MRSSLDKFFRKFKKERIRRSGKVTFWFFIGAALSLVLIASFSYLTFKNYYKEKVYPGISVNNVEFGEKRENEVREYFKKKNAQAEDITFIFKYEAESATVSAKEIDFGYDENLLADQAMSLGRSLSPFTNVNIILQAYKNGINLPASYRFSEEKLNSYLEAIYEEVNEPPIEALFNFENGRVTTFKASQDGKEIDKMELSKTLSTRAHSILNEGNQKIVVIPIPIKVLKPNITTEKVNKMGIKELIGSGTSLFQHSIESRIFNVKLAASRVNGVLIAPGETFSFAKTIGDISSFTGYKQAYVIENGRTVLGDGGGVCQVSTTLFRAILNSGLPITERHPHAYRVNYYEQESSPGIDATVFVPTVDFKFKNDTKHHVLIQTIVDPVELRLTFMLYGTRDGRISEVSTPVITSQSPAPEPKYEDDPNLAEGTVKQVDFAAAGASVYFTRTVTRDGKILTDERFNSNYRPWQAVYLRGTKK